MKLSEMFPRTYLSGADLAGRTWTVIITQVTREMLRVTPSSQPVEKYLLHLEGARKTLILNRTIAQQIANVLGSEDTDDWIGQKVALFPIPLNVAGQNRIAIRATTPVNGAALPPPESDAEEV